MGKYVFNHCGAVDAKGFEEATETIFNYIKKNMKLGDYVVHSIKDGVLNNPDKPNTPMKCSPIPEGTSMNNWFINKKWNYMMMTGSCTELNKRNTYT